MLEIPVQAIRANPDQPRKQFDQDALTELAESIREVGVLQPIVVREDSPGSYVIIAGERRWRATQRAGLPTIPARIRDLTGADEFVASVTENVARRDMTFMEEVDAYVRLADEFGFDADRIARTFGKSRSYVDIRLSMKQLTDSARVAVANGTLKPNLARYVADLSPSNQAAVLSRLGRGGFRTEIEAADFARALLAAQQQEELFALEAQEYQSTPAPAKPAPRVDPARVVAAAEAVARATNPDVLLGLDDETFDALQAALEQAVATTRAASRAMAVAAAHRASALVTA